MTRGKKTLKNNKGRPKTPAKKSAPLYLILYSVLTLLHLVAKFNTAIKSRDF